MQNTFNKNRLPKLLVVLGLMGGFLGACQTDTYDPQVNNPPAGTTDTTVGTNTNPNEPITGQTPVTTQPTTEIEQVEENTQQLVGQTVTLRGEVEEVYGPDSFRLQDDQVFGSDNVLVINANPAVPIGEDAEVQVVGEVRNFVVAEFERDYDLQWDATVRQNLEAEYQNKPVVVATTVQPVEANR
jgi:hypothetical protein